ncbi:hypothetical protein HYV74_00310 [Candidatus Uhrbacteria bacterium]|nr:hypothetical protein [Candidatus Uhrbacteria bacterium]
MPEQLPPSSPTPVVIRTVLGIIASSVFGAWLVQGAGAAVWTEPGAQPPTGNPPGFVWTQSPSASPQAGGQFNIEGAGRLGGVLEALGGGLFGSATFDLGNAAGGQSVISGTAQFDRMHAADALLLLQTDAGGTRTDRFRVDRSGAVTASTSVTAPQICIGNACRTDWPTGAITGVTAGTNLSGGGTTGSVTLNVVNNPTFSGDVSVGGRLNVTGCFGPVLRGKTSSTANGNRGGYAQINVLCPAGQHVCTTAEVLNSINCGAIGVGGLGISNGTDLWIANLAPSLPTPTNDCVGWTKDTAAWKGIKWSFHATTGGAAYAEGCNAALSFACCG